MTGLGIVLVILFAWMAFKVVGKLLKIAAFIALLIVGWWLLAPYLGWVTPAEFVRVMWL